MLFFFSRFIQKYGLENFVFLYALFTLLSYFFVVIRSLFFFAPFKYTALKKKSDKLPFEGLKTKTRDDRKVKDEK